MSIVLSDSQLERFWSKVDLHPTGCWEWQGVRNQYGYGRYRPVKPGPRFAAHRIVAATLLTAWDENLCVCHKCDNPSCVRPSHLFMGTKRDNTRDCINKGRFADVSRHGKRGENSHRAKVTEQQVRAMRARHAAGGVTIKALGEEYGVTLAGAWNIIRRTSWKWVS